MFTPNPQCTSTFACQVGSYLVLVTSTVDWSSKRISKFVASHDASELYDYAKEHPGVNVKLYSLVPPALTERQTLAVRPVAHEDRCPVCFDRAQNTVIMPCRHAMCYECYIRALHSTVSDEYTCCMCRGQITGCCMMEE